MRNEPTYGKDKMLRAEIVKERATKEKPLEVTQEGKCVQVRFPPGKNNLREGLDQETLLFHRHECATAYFEEIRHEVK